MLLILSTLSVSCIILCNLEQQSYFLHTHKHTFIGPLSATTRVSRYQKGKNQSGFYWSKRQWVAVASAGPYASLRCSRQIATPAPHPQFFTGQMPFLPPNQQRQSTEATATWRFTNFVLKALYILHMFIWYNKESHVKLFWDCWYSWSKFTFNCISIQRLLSEPHQRHECWMCQDGSARCMVLAADECNIVDQQW